VKIFFLDIDGVLNSINDFGPDAENVSIADKEKYYRRINKTNMANLNKIVLETGAKGILSSSWRMCGYKYIYENHLLPAGFIGELIGETDIYKDYVSRGFEIQKWLEKNGRPDSFTILDDDPDMNGLYPYLIQTDFVNDGLKEKHANWAINMLNGKTHNLEGPQILLEKRGL